MPTDSGSVNEGFDAGGNPYHAACGTMAYLFVNRRSAFAVNDMPACRGNGDDVSHGEQEEGRGGIHTKIQIIANKAILYW